MALCLLRSRVSAGRSVATGIAKAVSGGTNATKTVSYLGNVRRFSAGAGNNNNSGKITKACLLGTGVAVNGLVLGYFMEKYVDKRLASLDASQHAASTLSDGAKAEHRRYVDGKFSEAQGLAKSVQAEARAGVLQSRQHVDNLFARLEHNIRILDHRRAAEEKKLAEVDNELTQLTKEIEQIHRLARIRKQYDDYADKNSRMLAERQAADEKKLAELIKKIEQIHGEVRSCDQKLNSALSQQNSRAEDERKYADLRSDFANLRHEFQITDRKLNTAMSQMSSQAASEKKLADQTKKIEEVHKEVRSCDEKLNSALFQQNSQSANEGDYAELSSDVTKLRQEFQKIKRKINAGSEGMSSAECRNEIARVSEDIRNIKGKLNSRASSDGFFTECSNDVARLRQKVSRLEGIVDRLVEDSRRPPSDPSVGPSGPKPKKYKQD